MFTENCKSCRIYIYLHIFIIKKVATIYRQNWKKLDRGITINSINLKYRCYKTNKRTYQKTILKKKKQTNKKKKQRKKMIHKLSRNL